MSIPTRRVILINASGGALVTISASIPCAYVEIQECPPNGGTFNGSNYAPTGMNYNQPDDNFVATFGLNPGDVFSKGDATNKNRQIGMNQISFPDGTKSTATVYGKFVSATAGTTQVEVREWPQHA